MTDSLASVVMIAKVRIHSPEVGSFQFSHCPPIPNGLPSLHGEGIGLLGRLPLEDRFLDLFAVCILNPSVGCFLDELSRCRFLRCWRWPPRCLRPAVGPKVTIHVKGRSAFVLPPGGRGGLKIGPHAYHELKVQVLNWWHRGHSKVRSSVSSSRGIIVISVICVEVICVEHSGQAGRGVTPWTEGMRVVAGMRCTLTDGQEPRGLCSHQWGSRPS